MGLNDRKTERVYLSYILRLFRGDVLAGHIIDISETGVMIMTDGEYVEGEIYQFVMHLPDNVADGKNITFMALCRWIRPYPIDPAYLQVGLEFSEASDDIMTELRTLINDYYAR